MGLCAPIALSLMLAAASPRARADELRRDLTRDHPAAGIERMEIQNPAGLIEVLGEPREDFSFEIRFRLSGRKGVDTQSLLDRLGLAMESANGLLKVTPTFEGKALGGSLWGPLQDVRLRVDIVARSPRRMALTAAVTSGDLRIQDLEGDAALSATSGEAAVNRLGGDLMLTSTSGDLELQDLKGRVDVTTTTGDIVLRRMARNVWVHSLSGDINVEGVTGDLDVNNVNGDVAVDDVGGKTTLASSSGQILAEACAGALQINSSSGNITVISEGGAGQTLRLVSASGSVEVLLGAQAAFNLDLNTATGSIRCRLPLEVRDVSRRNLAAVLGGGGKPLKVVTATGDIRILRQED